MKTMKFFRLMTIPAIIAAGLIFSLSNCKKEKEIVKENVYINVHDTTRIHDSTNVYIHIHDSINVYISVHDTLKGKDITGVCTYPDYANTLVAAKGAVLSLYLGTTGTGVPIITTFADLTGSYAFKYLLPGTYFLTAKFNTENQNRSPINGVTFVYSGTVVTLAAANVTQNVVLASVAAPGQMKIAIDTIAAGVTYRKVTLEAHSKTPFETQHNMNQQALQGGFNVFKFDKFVFDEAVPANIAINAWVQASSINTFEPARDALAGGCVRKTLNVDTMMVGTTILPIPATDTIRFYASPGEVVKYGKGYLAHGHMRGFYKHAYGTIGVGGAPGTHIIPADTNYLQAAAGIAYGTTIDKPVDMYFEYMSKIKQISGANFTWMFTFEGKFTFNKSTGWYIKSTSIADLITVTPHVTMSGTTNKEY